MNCVGEKEVLEIIGARRAVLLALCGEKCGAQAADDCNHGRQTAAKLEYQSQEWGRRGHS